MWMCVCVRAYACARLHRIEVTGKKEEEEVVFFRETNRFCMQMYDNRKKSYSTIKMPIFSHLKCSFLCVCWLRWHVCNVALLTVTSLSRLFFTFLHINNGQPLLMRFDFYLIFIFFLLIPIPMALVFLVGGFRFYRFSILGFYCIVSVFIISIFIFELARITWKSCIPTWNAI